MHTLVALLLNYFLCKVACTRSNAKKKHIENEILEVRPNSILSLSVFTHIDTDNELMKVNKQNRKNNS